MGVSHSIRFGFFFLGLQKLHAQRPWVPESFRVPALIVVGTSSSTVYRNCTHVLCFSVVMPTGLLSMRSHHHRERSHTQPLRPRTASFLNGFVLLYYLYTMHIFPYSYSFMIRMIFALVVCVCGVLCVCGCECVYGVCVCCVCVCVC